MSFQAADTRQKVQGRGVRVKEGDGRQEEGEERENGSYSDENEEWNDLPELLPRYNYYESDSKSEEYQDDESNISIDELSYINEYNNTNDKDEKERVNFNLIKMNEEWSDLPELIPR